MYLAQIIPDPNKLMDASNSLIVDQGIAIFAVVVFAIVIFGMMGLMFMMQRQTGAMLRQMGKESSQQDKLITQNDLNRVAAQRNTDELIDVKDLLSRLIDMQTDSNNDKQTVIKDGIKSIEDNTESVGTMNGKLEDLEKAVKDMDARTLSMETEVKTLSANMVMVLERLNELKVEAETPTEETEAIKPPLGKPSIGVPATRSATYPPPDRERGTDHAKSYPHKSDKDKTGSA